LVLTDWPVPSAVTYIEVADRLLLMAAQAQSQETRLQFERLARLYEKLAAAAVRYHSDPLDTSLLDAAPDADMTTPAMGGSRTRPN
jgi:hypothetical protein